MNGSIYDVNKAFQSLAEMLENGDLSQEDFASALAELEQSKVEKCGNAICYLNMRKQMIEAMKNEEKRIATQRKALENGDKSLENAFAYVLNNMGGKEVITPFGVMKIRKNPPSVVVDDVTKIDAKYTQQKIRIDIDKIAIKKAIQAGENVAGARLEQTEKLVY
jgi:uncharacterized protein YqgQ